MGGRLTSSMGCPLDQVGCPAVTAQVRTRGVDRRVSSGADKLPCVSRGGAYFGLVGKARMKLSRFGIFTFGKV